MLKLLQMHGQAVTITVFEILMIEYNNYTRLKELVSHISECMTMEKKR